MFEWLSPYYLKLIANTKILIGNPTQCTTVELLRLFSLTLFLVFLIKLVIHLFVFNRLRKRFPEYSEETYPHLFRRFRIAVQKLHLRRLPPLYQFSNERPILFTIGSLRPAIFLAPALVDKLPQKEMEAALIHELTHVKRRDNLLIWLLEIFLVSIPLLVIQAFAVNFVLNLEHTVYAILGGVAALILFKAFLWPRILFLRELSCDDLCVVAIKDPLLLASSLIDVWRIGSVLPRYRWQTRLAFAQTVLPAASNPEARVRRLINYRRPRFKFFLAKAIRITTAIFVVFTATFLWGFYSAASHGPYDLDKNKQCKIYYSRSQILGSGEAPVASGQGMSTERFTRVVGRFVQALNAQDLEGMMREFGKNTTKYPEKLNRLLIGRLLRKLGTIQELGEPHLISSNQAMVPAHFERANLNMRVTLDDQDRITGLEFELQL